MEHPKAISNKEELLKAILVSELKEELAKNNMLVKDGAFTLNEKAKKALEKELGRTFKKNRFSSKNELLYNAVKEQLEKLHFTVLNEKELEKLASEKLEKLEKELEKELEEQAKKASEESKKASEAVKAS